MQIEKATDSESIQFFLEDSHMPSIIMGMHGEIFEANTLFRENFDMSKQHNIKELFDRANIEVWNDFFEIISSKSTTFIARRTLLALDKASLIKVRLLYCPRERKVAAIFTMPIIGQLLQDNYLKAFKRSNDLMVLVDCNGIIRDANDLSETFFGITREELILKKGIDVLSKLIKCPYKIATFCEKVKMDGNAEADFQLSNNYNEIKHFHINTFYDKETNMYVTRVTDKTAKNKLEDQLAHADSLSSVGQLAASIAHEIRNPMTTLKGFVQLLKATSPEESQNYLSVIDDEIERMESILTEMLTLSKPSSDKKEILSLQDAIADVCRIISPKAHLENINIVLQDTTIYEAFIYANFGKIKQALLNIFKNGMEAMPSGGTLTIKLDRDTKGCIQLSISDTGIGIPTSQINDIFTPFFTMKDSGTGLGLPFVKKTVTDHNGMIKVESEINQGTKFILSFPPAVNQMPFIAANEFALSTTGKMA